MHSGKLSRYAYICVPAEEFQPAVLLELIQQDATLFIPSPGETENI